MAQATWYRLLTLLRYDGIEGNPSAFVVHSYALQQVQTTIIEHSGVLLDPAFEYPRQTGSNYSSVEMPLTM